MIIYKITNKINGKSYIGQTTQPLSKRWKSHTYSKNYNSAIHMAIKKYGKENFDIKVICRCNSVEELNNKEIFCIRIFKTISPHGYNLKIGGAQGGPLSNESKLKISMSKMGHISTFKGRIHSEESKKKNSLAHKGRKSTKQTKEKQSKASKGRKMSKEFVDKLKKPIICNETNVVYPSINEAASFFKVNNKSIRRILKGERKSFRGLTFSYCKDICNV